MEIEPIIFLVVSVPAIFVHKIPEPVVQIN